MHSAIKNLFPWTHVISQAGSSLVVVPYHWHIPENLYRPMKNRCKTKKMMMIITGSLYPKGNVGRCPGVCCQFVNKRLEPASCTLWDFRFSRRRVWRCHPCNLTEADYSTTLHGAISQKAAIFILYFFVFIFLFGNRDGQYTSVYGWINIDVLILVYRAFHLIFSVPIKAPNYILIRRSPDTVWAPAAA
jgi:hypothetical protein